MSNKETIVALKSDEQASLSPGAYEVLTAAVKKRDVVGLLRGLERHGEDNIWRVAQEAREEIERIRAALALAANRMDVLALDHDYGTTRRNIADDWAKETRAALGPNVRGKRPDTAEQEQR